MKAREEGNLTPGEIDEVQRQAWSETFHYVSHHSPFYRRHFLEAGLKPGMELPLSQIESIPPIDKATLSANLEAFLCVPDKKIIDVVTTSGSTGKPLIWKLTERDLERLGRNEYLSFRCVGLSDADTVLLAVALDRCFIAGMAYFLGLRKLGCSVVRAGPASPLMQLELIQRLRATAVVGVPSFLRLVADKAAEIGFNLRQAGVTKAICIGEPVRQPNLALNSAGEVLEGRWGAKVFSTYGVTELAASLCECEADSGGHLHPELLFLEVLEEAGRRVPDGEIGELTATTLGVEGMPLVRYRTGDCGALFHDRCSCGRATARLGPIVGRKHQKLKVKGTTLFPSTLKEVLDAEPGVTSYVVLARREKALCDTIEIRLDCAGSSEQICHALRERFQAKAKVVPQLTLATAAEIQALQQPEGGRKRCYFVDLRD